MAIVDHDFTALASWTLMDADPAQTGKKQKNWMPFWDVKRAQDTGQNSCRLLLSKRFAPQHIVGEFTDWSAASGTKVFIETVASSTSPAHVPAETFVRGSAPPVVHPQFKEGFAIGCIHVKGKHKVYRHALYIIETSHPYRIVSFSSLFSFNPLRNIEFVMSLYITGTCLSTSCLLVDAHYAAHAVFFI